MQLPQTANHRAHVFLAPNQSSKNDWRPSLLCFCIRLTVLAKPYIGSNWPSDKRLRISAKVETPKTQKFWVNWIPESFRILCLWLNFSPSVHLLNFPPSYEKARIPMELTSLFFLTASSNDLKGKSSSVIIWPFPQREMKRAWQRQYAYIGIGENSIRVLLWLWNLPNLRSISVPACVPVESIDQLKIPGNVLTVPVSAVLSHLASPGWLYA